MVESKNIKLPGLHNPEEEIVRMIAFLVTVSVAALLVVAGVKASLRLRVPGIPARRRLSGLRRSYSAPMVYSTPKNIRDYEDAISRYPRKAFVLTILILVMLSVLIIHIISLAVH
jgi:hypothetical protein